jgi:hypothetical protein
MSSGWRPKSPAIHAAHSGAASGCRVTNRNVPGDLVPTGTSAKKVSNAAGLSRLPMRLAWA